MTEADGGVVVIQVDRVEGSWAVVLEGDAEFQIPSHWLPEGAGEGSILQVEFRHDVRAETDLSERVSGSLDRLKLTDDEGDFSL